jgi:hypothetical protein
VSIDASAGVEIVATTVRGRALERDCVDAYSHCDEGGWRVVLASAHAVILLV